MGRKENSLHGNGGGNGDVKIHSRSSLLPTNSFGYNAVGKLKSND